MSDQQYPPNPNPPSLPPNPNGEDHPGFVLFWDGEFSQWYNHWMEIDGVEYSCCEQYMMAQKALLFGDQETHDKIMKTRIPRIMKQLGREVKNFDAAVWDAHAEDIVYKANFAKFSEEPLKTHLLDTDNLDIAEASPYDLVWGIGIDAKNPDALDKSKWRGQNKLGNILMRVREALRDQAN